MRSVTLCLILILQPHLYGGGTLSRCIIEEETENQLNPYVLSLLALYQSLNPAYLESSMLHEQEKKLRPELISHKLALLNLENRKNKDLRENKKPTIFYSCQGKRAGIIYEEHQNQVMVIIPKTQWDQWSAEKIKKNRACIIKHVAISGKRDMAILIKNVRSLQYSLYVYPNAQKPFKLKIDTAPREYDNVAVKPFYIMFNSNNETLFVWLKNSENELEAIRVFPNIFEKID